MNYGLLWLLWNDGILPKKWKINKVSDLWKITDWNITSSVVVPEESFHHNFASQCIVTPPRFIFFISFIHFCILLLLLYNQCAEFYHYAVSQVGIYSRFSLDQSLKTYKIQVSLSGIVLSGQINIYRDVHDVSSGCVELCSYDTNVWNVFIVT